MVGCHLPVLINTQLGPVTTKFEFLYLGIYITVDYFCHSHALSSCLVYNPAIILLHVTHLIMTIYSFTLLYFCCRLNHFPYARTISPLLGSVGDYH